MSRYLVTGAGGFIGRRLSEYLISQGHEVWALLRNCTDGPWDRIFYCDLGNEPLPAGLMENIHGVFHLANIAHTDLTGNESGRYWQVNVLATETLLLAAINAGVSRFIYFSSVKAADPNESYVDGQFDRIPNDDYGRSKREAERLVLKAGLDSKLHVCNLRPALVYGAGVKGNLSRMLQAVKHGRFPPLPEFNNRRSMVALDDLVSAACLVMESPRADGKTYIVSDGVDYSSRMLFESMSKALSVPIPSWFVPKGLLYFGARLGDGLEWFLKRKMPLNSVILKRLIGSAYYRADAIKDELGWQPTLSFLDVLPEMIKSMR